MDSLFPSLSSAFLAAWRENVFKRKDRSRRDAEDAKKDRFLALLPAIQRDKRNDSIVKEH